MNDFFSSFYPLEKLQFGSDDTVYLLITYFSIFSFEKMCILRYKLDVLIFFQDDYIWVIDVVYKKFMYRAKTMTYVKVVLKIRYDPRVKRLSKSHKKKL